ncbi:MFS transporter [Planomonospora algeriensis]
MTPPATAVRSSGAALALLVTTQFVLVLDSTIVGVALPSIARDLDLAQEDLSWVNNAYVLVFGGFLMLGGRLADLAGRRRVFVAGLLLFTLASLAGGLAPTPGVLIACRAVQGLASALVAPAALSLLMTVFPDGTPQEKARRNRALGVYGAVSGAGGAAGMVLGGLLTDGFGWEAVFYVNVPIGVAGALLAPVLLPPGRAGERGGGFDLAGATTVTAGLALLVYVLVGTERNGWASAQTLGLGGLAVALLAAFAWIETRSGQPLVPLGIFRRRTLRGANLVGALIPMGVIPSIFFLTLYTQQVLGFSPLASGLALAPLALSVVLAATTVGRFLARLGLRLATAAGACWSPAACSGPPGSPAGRSCSNSSARRSSSGSAAAPSGSPRPSPRPPTPPSRRRASPRACSTPPTRSAPRSAWPSWRPSRPPSPARP